MGRSAVMLGLPLPDPDEIVDLAGLVIDAVPAAVATSCSGSTGHPGPPGGDSLAIALVSPVPSWIEEVRPHGQRLASLAFPRRSVAWLLPGTKSTSYATHLAAEAEARRRGADDAVLVDLDGTVLEGTVTNIWWREGETLFTPSLDLGILAGETRAALARDRDRGRVRPRGGDATLSAAFSRQMRSSPRLRCARSCRPAQSTSVRLPQARPPRGCRPPSAYWRAERRTLPSERWATRTRAHG